MKTALWKVWTSESVYDSIKHKVSEIPHDVQIVMYYLDYPKRHVEMGEDSYIVDGVTLHGKYMDESKFWKISDKAMADMEWPK